MVCFNNAKHWWPKGDFTRFAAQLFYGLFGKVENTHIKSWPRKRFAAALGSWVAFSRIWAAKQILSIGEGW